MEHSLYNTTNFPHRVGNHGNWDIYRNDKDKCAAIPTEDAARIGCRASHFGDMNHVRSELGEAWLEQQTYGRLTKAPDVRTKVSRLDDASGEVFQVVAWLKAQAEGPTCQPLVFCPQDEATHVLGQSLWVSGPEVNDQAIALGNLQVGRASSLSYWCVREHAQALGRQRAALGSVAVPRWG